MPFALLFIGLVLIVTAVRNQQAPFVALVGGDFSGQGNFFYWVVALIVVGSIGYIPKAKPISDGLLVLIILSLVLAVGKPSAPGGGVFQQLQSALKSTGIPSSAAIGTQASSIGTAVGTAVGVGTAVAGGQ